MDEKPAILIVDDKEANLIALEKVLQGTNSEVIRANNGNEALKAVLNHDFALAILDVQMPGMDGYELAELLRGEVKTKTLPIIFLSAVYSDKFHVFKGYEAGAVDFITKPYEPTIMLSKVRVFLRLKEEILNRQRVENELRIENQRLTKEYRRISKLETEEKPDNSGKKAGSQKNRKDIPVKVNQKYSDLINAYLGNDDKETERLVNILCRIFLEKDMPTNTIVELHLEAVKKLTKDLNDMEARRKLFSARTALLMVMTRYASLLRKSK